MVCSELKEPQEFGAGMLECPFYRRSNVVQLLILLLCFLRLLLSKLAYIFSFVLHFEAKAFHFLDYTSQCDSPKKSSWDQCNQKRKLRSFFLQNPSALCKQGRGGILNGWSQEALGRHKTNHFSENYFCIHMHSCFLVEHFMAQDDKKGV